MKNSSPVIVAFFVAALVVLTESQDNKERKTFALCL
jgi:hypothetical protein